MSTKDIDAISKAKSDLARKFTIEDDTAIDAAFTALLATPNGRKFLWWVLGLGGLGRNPFANNALVTGFNCGELNVSQKFLDRIIQVNPAGYAQMVTENADERDRRNQLLDAVGDTPGEYGNDAGD